MYPTSLFNNYLMRLPKNSELADVLKTKPSHHKGKKEEFEGCRYGNRDTEHQ